MSTSYDTVPRLSLISASLASQDLGIVPGSGSSISNRHHEGMLITPATLPTNGMTADDIVYVHAEGKADGRVAPADDWRVHLGVYFERPDVHAIARLQTPAATALASLRRPLPPFHHRVIDGAGGTVHCTGYAAPGSRALATKVVAALDGRAACLMANNALLVCGKSTTDVMQLGAELEALADQYLRACAIGDPALLVNSEIVHSDHDLVDLRH